MENIKWQQKDENTLVTDAAPHEEVRIIREDSTTDSWIAIVGVSVTRPMSLVDAMEEAKRMMEAYGVKPYSIPPLDISEIFASMLANQPGTISDFDVLISSEDNKGLVVATFNEGDSSKVALMIVDNGDPEESQGINLTLTPNEAFQLSKSLKKARKEQTKTSKAKLQKEIDEINRRGKIT